MMKLRMRSSRRVFSHISASGPSSKEPAVGGVTLLPCDFHSTKNFHQPDECQPTLRGGGTGGSTGPVHAVWKLAVSVSHLLSRFMRQQGQNFLHHFRTSSAALPRLGRPAVSLSHLLNQNVTTD